MSEPTRKESLPVADIDAPPSTRRLAVRKLKWQPADAIHEEGMPYLVWDLADPGIVELMTSIDEYRTITGRMSDPRAMSVRPVFMRGYQPEIDEVLNG